MAKVKITGHASGTGVVTVTAPNTSTDRTITLPDATGTLLNSDGSGASLTNLPADATKLPLAGGTMTGTIAGFTSTGIDDNATSTAITIDAAENVGIGSAPESGISSDVVEVDMGLMSLSIWKGENQPNDSASYGYNCYKTSGFAYKAKKTSTGADFRPSVYEQAYGQHYFKVATTATADAAITWTTAMTIDNSGKVGIGETPDANFGLKVKNNVVASSLETTSGTGSHEGLIINRTGSDGWMIAFNRDGSTKGGIVQSGSSTAFNTSSDYRLKENVDYTWDATTRLKQLKPARFNFIEDETNTLVDGFLAHEAATVVPEAITGTKDAMKDEEYVVTPAVMDGGIEVTPAVMGTRSVPNMQGIDQSKLVPLLVKTIQELEARITTLEA